MDVRVEKALSNWTSLIKTTSKMSVDELDAALSAEMLRSKPRRSFVIRIHQCLSSKRSKKDRAELLRNIKR